MSIQIRDGLKDQYTDVYTPEALAALEALSGVNKKQKALMAKRYQRRNDRYSNKKRITFHKLLHAAM